MCYYEIWKDSKGIDSNYYVEGTIKLSAISLGLEGLKNRFSILKIHLSFDHGSQGRKLVNHVYLNRHILERRVEYMVQVK